jgi:N-acetylmuramoyl-L-alanine amidase
VNAAQSRAASGSETFVMGVNKTSSNLEVTMLENSVIMLEGDDYSTRYEGFNPNDPESYIVFSLLQNAHIEQSLLMASLVQKQFAKGPIKIDRGIKQGPLLVLWKTGMPGVLVELGFISNQNDLRILNDKKSHDKFAEGIFNAFEEYKNQYEKGYQNTSAVNDSSLSRTIEASLRDTSVSVKPSPQPSLQEHFRIQILAVSKILPSGAPDLKGRRDAKYIKAGNLYKYTIGEYKTVEEAKLAQDEIRRVFPQAFIIKVRNNTIVPLNN